MVTLESLCCWRRCGALFHITGGTDGLQGIEMQRSSPVRVQCSARSASSTVLACCRAVPAGAADRALAVRLSLRAIRNNPLRAAAIGIPVKRRLIAVYTWRRLCGHRRRAVHQTTALASLDVFSLRVRPI